jgi:hypothetical protein
MIKFFRKIRQKILSENKFSKYLLYAIGEIILVVIGILIALSINNKNEYNKYRSEEIVMLKNLILEFESNIPILQENIMTHTLTQKACKDLLVYTRPNPTIPNNKTIDSLLGWSIVSPRFNYKDGALQSVINSGKLGFILNDSIRNKIAEFSGIIGASTITETTLREISASDYKIFLEQYTAISENLRGANFFKQIMPEIKVSEFEYKREDILSNRDFEGKITHRVIMTELAIFELKELENELNGVIALISEELKRRE